MRCSFGPLNQTEKNVKAFSIVNITSHREMVVKEMPHTILSSPITLASLMWTVTVNTVCSGMGS